MDARQQLLLLSAARLYALGVDVEGAREELRRLTESNISFESPEMLAAYNSFRELDMQWKALEAEYLRLRSERAGQKCDQRKSE